MLTSFVVGALSFHAGGSFHARRAPVVTMGPAVPSVGEFIYGAPVTLSSGYSRSGTPNTACSFNAADMVGKVVPTGGAASTPAKPAKSTTIVGSFVYAPPTPLSKGLPGFSNQCSF